MDAKQFAELTGTNRPCDLTMSLRQTSNVVREIRIANLAPSLRTDDPKVSGGDLEEATPDPIPNSEVKLLGANGTAREAVWESRTLPGFMSTGPVLDARVPFFFVFASGRCAGNACLARGALSWPVT